MSDRWVTVLAAIAGAFTAWLLRKLDAARRKASYRRRKGADTKVEAGHQHHGP